MLISALLAVVLFITCFTRPDNPYCKYILDVPEGKKKQIKTKSNEDMSNQLAMTAY